MVPNLRKSMVEEFWGAKDARLARIFEWMESMEPWTLDEQQDVFMALNNVLGKLEKLPARAVYPHSDDLIDILTYLSSARSLRILEWLDEKSSNEKLGIVVDLIEKARERASDDVGAELFLERLQALKSLALLGRIFSPNRTRTMADLLRQDSNNAVHG